MTIVVLSFRTQISIACATFIHEQAFPLIPMSVVVFFFFQAEDGIRDKLVTGVQTCALPISLVRLARHKAAGLESIHSCGSTRVPRPCDARGAPERSQGPHRPANGAGKRASSESIRRSPDGDGFSGQWALENRARNADTAAQETRHFRRRSAAPEQSHVGHAERGRSVRIGSTVEEERRRT